ncbi:MULTISPECIES: phosphoribosylglycinamide formyltransferase [Exiguobacterium]|uniref:phosphoribosylglycinamide formyltransferase n=1 Tax=Exiguobacterium TaxID=33986 RepID=UPI0005142830|nr:phosphoribosylglycinamide formyltransferase [Exiguobacterium sp. AM39-5BH]KGI84325.1 phosphoribosylglycinamide formyltransferase [Exiguobacterium mexicanum]RHB48413.1 phosphoribosylglycinamide formyltransferase [Exiguobacterium sp. AM39-5BH]
MKKFAIFASGSGSNAEAIWQAIDRGDLSGECVLLVTDKPEAKVLERADRFNIASFSFEPKAYASKAEFEQEILVLLQTLGADYIVLAGYMRLIGDVLLSAYPNRIINIHPSLLPAFPGKDAIGQALAANVPTSGVTVHYVDAGMDTGPIIAQQDVAIAGCDAAEAARRIQAVEHQLYPHVLQQVFIQQEVFK